MDGDKVREIEDIDNHDPIGKHVVRKARGATRVGCRKYHRYDGRLVRKQVRNVGESPFGCNDEDAEFPSGHHVHELVKGLFFLKPHLYNATFAQLYLNIARQAAYQFRPEMAEFIEEHLSELGAILNFISPSMTACALADVRNHDEDVYNNPELRDEYERHRPVYSEALEGIDKRWVRRHLTSWVKSGSRALTAVEKANETRDAVLKHPEVVDIVRDLDPEDEDDLDTIEMLLPYLRVIAEFSEETSNPLTEDDLQRLEMAK